ncbi:cation:proton antiporter domain-containing protein [Caldisericum exile]|uniref:Transporter n=1 Tax=Caldisericum exile (strain DSM 21853 / NBRC 104410 / AZM16c01) TaxID=511051 RepID=A0A7U6JGV3_CALEA|nr:cation:proton antiporter [Caldisericum exile]BAL80902.1 putative transporter [Caldisericum exile AZM16c01]
MGALIIFISLSIIGGLIASYLVSKSDFPTITGLIIVGLFVTILPFTKNLILSFSPIFQLILEIAVTLLLFETGLEVVYLKRNKKIIFAASIQSIFTFIIVFAISTFIFKLNFIEGIVIATIWMVTGSDISITLLKKMDTSPELKVQLGTMVVIDDLLTEIFFFAFFPILKFNKLFQSNSFSVILSTIEEVTLSLILGVIIGLIIDKFEKYGYKKFPQVIASFAFITLIVGLQYSLKIHAVMVSLVAGMTFTITSKFEVVRTVRLALREIDQLFYTLFVVFSISYVGFPKIEKYLLLGLLILIIRLFGKLAGAIIIKHLKLVESSSIFDILIPMLPQSILSAYFAYLARDYFSIFGGSVFAIVIASIILFETLGYFLTQKLTLNNKQQK